MSLMQKKIVLIASGILILLITFFLVFQKNQETVYQLEGETRNYQKRLNSLQGESAVHGSHAGGSADFLSGWQFPYSGSGGGEWYGGRAESGEKAESGPDGWQIFYV